MMQSSRLQMKCDLLSCPCCTAQWKLASSPSRTVSFAPGMACPMCIVLTGYRCEATWVAGLTKAIVLRDMRCDGSVQDCE